MKADGAAIFGGRTPDLDARRWCFAEAGRTFEFSNYRNCNMYIALWRN